MRFLNATEYSKWIVVKGDQDMSGLSYILPYKVNLDHNLVYLFSIPDMLFLENGEKKPIGFRNVNDAYEVMSILTKKKPLTVKDKIRLEECGYDLGNLEKE